MKSIEEIKRKACIDSDSLIKTLECFDLSLDDVGVFFLNENASFEQVDSKDYPVCIFYSAKKDEIKQLKVDFTHEKIKESVKNHKKIRNYSIAS